MLSSCIRTVQCNFVGNKSIAKEGISGENDCQMLYETENTQSLKGRLCSIAEASPGCLWSAQAQIMRGRFPPAAIEVYDNIEFRSKNQTP